MAMYFNDDKGFQEQIKQLQDIDTLCDKVLYDCDNEEKYYEDDDENGDPEYNWEWLRGDVHEALDFLYENCDFTDPDQVIALARCINLNKISDFNKDNMGDCWTTPRYFYEFASNNLSKKDLYCITALTKAKNIDWVESSILFCSNEYEYELRVMNDTPETIWNIKLWKVVNGKMSELVLDDVKKQLQESMKNPCCPECRGKLIGTNDKDILLCRTCQKKYRLDKDNVPKPLWRFKFVDFNESISSELPDIDFIKNVIYNKYYAQHEPEELERFEDYQNFEEYAEQINRKFKSWKFPLLVFRGLKVPEGKEIRLDKTVGEHWTDNYNLFYHKGDYGFQEPNVILCGEITPDMINWKQTVLDRYCDCMTKNENGREYEIELKKDAIPENVQIDTDRR